MKECELCERPARMYCESDQASLCWACDAKVHSANFLVARHTRSLLCRACQAPTPWRAAGARLGPSVSVCQKCVGRCGGRKSSEVEVDSGERTSGRADEIEKAEDEDDYDDDDNDDEEGVEGEEDEDDGEDEEEDGENQVVPLTSMSPLSLSGPAASLSSEDESSGHGGGFFGTSTTLMKRRREDEDFLHQERFGCSSSQANEDGELSSTPSRAPKDRKITSGETEAVTVSRTNLAGTGRSTRNERWNRVERASTAVGTCSRREDPRSAVHLVSDGFESRPM